MRLPHWIASPPPGWPASGCPAPPLLPTEHMSSVTMRYPVRVGVLLLAAAGHAAAVAPEHHGWTTSILVAPALPVLIPPRLLPGGYWGMAPLGIYLPPSPPPCLRLTVLGSPAMFVAPGAHLPPRPRAAIGRFAVPLLPPISLPALPLPPPPPVSSTTLWIPSPMRGAPSPPPCFCLTWQFRRPAAYCTSYPQGLTNSRLPLMGVSG